MKRLKIFLGTLAAVCILGGIGILVLSKLQAGAAVQTPGTEAGNAAGSEAGVLQLSGSEETAGSGEAAAEPGDAQTDTDPYGAELSGTTRLGEGCNYSRRYSVDTTEDGVVTLGFVGDILLDPEYSIYKTYLERECVLEACVDPELLERLHRLDVLTVNNEFPYSDRGVAQAGKTYTFRAPCAHVEILKDLGADIADIANNHAYDYGQEAFLDTMDTLYEAGIPYVGGGHDIEEAMMPVILYAADMKIGIVASTQIERQGSPDSLSATEERPGMLRSWPSIDPTLAALQQAKAECDYVILLIHWGTESETEIDWCQREQMPQFVEAGADIIIGAHPHILQKIDWVDGVPVIYSLGNFWFSSREMDSCLLELTLAQGGLKSLRFVPCQQRGCGVRLLKEAEAERLLNYMRRISPGVDINAEGIITAK